MVAWSSFALRNVFRCSLSRKGLSPLKNELNIRHGIQNAVSNTVVRGHKTMTIEPSKYHWDKFKDMAIFYFLLGAIPLSLISLYCHIFIGPATLAVIPEGYEPQPWEYHKNPITRFFAKYITMSPQECHERNLHNIFIHNEKFLIRELELKIERLIRERLDYQAFYMIEMPAKYHKLSKEMGDRASEDTAQSHGWVK